MDSEYSRGRGQRKVPDASPDSTACFLFVGVGRVCGSGSVLGGSRAKTPSKAEGQSLTRRFLASRMKGREEGKNKK